MAPTLTAAYPVGSAAGDLSTLTTSSFTPATGEIIVVKTGAGTTTTAAGTPTGGSLTYTSWVSLAAATNAPVTLWTATVGASPGAMTVSVTWTGTNDWHAIVVERWSGALLDATPATAGVQGSTTGQTTITTVGTNSMVSWLDADWNGVSPGTPTYASGATQTGLISQPTFLVVYGAYQTAASAGSQTFGVTAPTGQKASLVAVELRDAVPPVVDSLRLPIQTIQVP
jgi:hypothetical protein